MLGVIGDPVAHTASPAMHNAALRALDLNYVYAAFRVDPAALPQALAGMRAFGMVGLNVTVPHKQAVMAHLDEISAEAQSIGRGQYHCQPRWPARGVQHRRLWNRAKPQGRWRFGPAAS